MEFLLNRGNLRATHYDNGNHTLEFVICGMRAFVTVKGLGAVEDQRYWYDEDRIHDAIASVNSEDIDVYLTIDGGKTVKIVKE